MTINYVMSSDHYLSYIHDHGEKNLQKIYHLCKRWPADGPIAGCFDCNKEMGDDR